MSGDSENTFAGRLDIVGQMVIDGETVFGAFIECSHYAIRKGMCKDRLRMVGLPNVNMALRNLWGQNVVVSLEDK